MSRPARRLALQAAGIVCAELDRPAPDGFKGDDDPTLEKHLLDQAQTERKSEVQPHRIGYDIGWETMML